MIKHIQIYLKKELSDKNFQYHYGTKINTTAYKIIYLNGKFYMLKLITDNKINNLQTAKQS